MENLDFLVKRWKEASNAYYNLEPIMSDTEFDELTDILKQKYSDIPAVQELLSSIQTTDGLRSEHAPHESISLKKIKYKDKSSITEIKQFFKQPEFINRKDKRLFISPKLDGNALKLIWTFTYNMEKLTILTRGGMEVTEEFKSIPGIMDCKPKNPKTSQVIITGELVIDKKLFETKYSVLNGGDYENARNFVGGQVTSAAKSSIPQEIKNDLIFVPCTDGINPYFNDSKLWKEITFEDFYNLEKEIAFFKSNNFPYLCDGIVIAFIEDGPRRVHENYPLNMVAIKFSAPRAKTKVINIEWTQKKTGNLTPILQLEPIKLEGSIIQYANGYNYMNLIENHIGIGSIVEIEKSGDIIPVIAKVLSYSNQIKMPTQQYMKVGRHLKAVNLEESEKYKFQLALTLLNIDGIGPTIAEKIGNLPSINYNIINVFDVKNKPDICQALNNGILFQKFAKEIYSIKTMYLDKLIHIMQFDGIGPKMSLMIAEIISGKHKNTKNMTQQALNICKGENIQKIRETIGILKQYGIAVIKPIDLDNSNVITCEMTGEPGMGLTKDKFIEKMKLKFPGIIHTSLTKQTNYLFTDSLNGNSGKMNKARKYSVNIMTYSDALKASEL